MSKKALNFDLNDSSLRKNYPSNNYRKAWKDIFNYLTQHGFMHRKYSGYISCHTVSMIYVTQTIADMSFIFDWLQYCVKEFDMTLIGDEFSLKNIFNKKIIFVIFINKL